MKWPIGRLHKRASIIIATRTGAVNTKIRFFQSASAHLLFSPLFSLILSIAKPPFHFESWWGGESRPCLPRWRGTAGHPAAHGLFAPLCHRRPSTRRWGEGTREGPAVGQRQWSGLLPGRSSPGGKHSGRSGRAAVPFPRRPPDISPWGMCPAPLSRRSGGKKSTRKIAPQAL